MNEITPGHITLIVEYQERRACLNSFIQIWGRDAGKELWQRYTQDHGSQFLSFWAGLNETHQKYFVEHFNRYYLIR